MKFGILGSKGYPDLKSVQKYIEYLQYMYRPFGNCDDEWEEEITLVTELKSQLDCTAAVSASQSNFKVEAANGTEELLNKSDKVIVFWNGDCKKVREVIDLTLDNTVPLEVIYPRSNNENTT